MKTNNFFHHNLENDPITVWDWLLYAALTIFCFFSFIYSDIYVTGNRAFFLYESGLTEFYDAVHTWTKDYGANYMPSTFWLFSIWLLPLKLLGFSAPPTINAETTRLFYGLWYKTLPCIFFFVSAYLMYRIALQIGLNKRRAKVCMYAFMTMPIGYFSQFIFSQYDIFTVTFMLLGMFFYFKDREDTLTNKSHWLFCLFFGISVTFKYYALLIFIVLLFVRTKDVKKIILSLFLMALPFALEYMLYMDSEGFQIGVFGFNALGYISESNISTIIGNVSYVKAGCVFILIWSYFVTVDNAQDEVRWILYLSCGICFALFDFATWHPQWLLFAVPFWVLSASISQHKEKFYWGNIIFVVVFYMFIVQHWAGGVDNAMLQLGVWKYLLAEYPLVGFIAEMIPLIDKDTLYSIIFAIILAMFVFTHPKYTLNNFSEDDHNDYMPLIRLQLLVAVFGFVIPCFYTVYRSIL